jgi:hypothetical protein
MFSDSVLTILPINNGSVHCRCPNCSRPIQHQPIPTQHQPIVLDPPYHYTYQDLRSIGNRLLGKSLHQALRIYPNIRVVIRNGQPLIIGQDYQPNRISVETLNDIITRIVAFY